MEFIAILIVLILIDQLALDGTLSKTAIKAIQSKEKPKELGGRREPLSLTSKKQSDPYDCEVYDERLVDLKMVKAGLMKPSDVAQCDSRSCNWCK